MKAFLISEYAHPSKIQLTHDAPEPTPTPGSNDLLINVHSAALNFFDVRLSPSLPFPPHARRRLISQTRGLADFMQL